MQCGWSVEEEVLCQLARRFQPGVARMASRLYRLLTGLHLDHASAYIEDYILYALKYSQGLNFRRLQIYTIFTNYIFADGGRSYAL